MTNRDPYRDLYAQQRYQRLDEAVFDYLQDDLTSVEDLLGDLRTIIIENRAYFQKHVARNDRALEGLNQIGVEIPTQEG